MNKFIKLLCVTSVALVATTANADQFNGGDQIIPHHVYDASIKGTVLGVKLTYKDKGTVYQVGQFGLTKEMIMDESGDALEAWAMDQFGKHVYADMTMYSDSGVDDQ